MINNTSLLNNVKRLPEKSVFEMISFLINNYKSIHAVSDIDGFPDSINDVSHLEEAKEEMASLDIGHYDKYHMLAFNAKLSLIGKFELIFSENKLVQSGLQFIFYNEYFHSFFEVFSSCKDIMGRDFLIDHVALDDTHMQVNPLAPLRDLVRYYFSFYDIPSSTPKDIENFAKVIFKLSESEQKKATFDFLKRKLANGESLDIDDLRIHNTIQGYMSLASPPNSQTSSLNIRIVEMEWCNAVYR